MTSKQTKFNVDHIFSTTSNHTDITVYMYNYIIVMFPQFHPSMHADV